MSFLRAFIFCCASVIFWLPGEAAAYNSVVVFGDSLSDNGNLYAGSGNTIPPSPPYYQGRRSDGKVAVEYLAQSLVAPLLDYAYIGATTGVGGYDGIGNVTTPGPIPGMSAVYANVAPSLTAPVLADGLFIVWGGPNDLLAPAPSDAGNPAAIMARSISNLITIVAGLQAQGAQHILVPGMPDLGLTPFFIGLGQSTAASQYTDAFNGLLQASLPSGVTYFDTAGLIRDVVANSAAYGFTNTTGYCLTGVTVCANPSEYVFFDDFHPTTHTHAILAQALLQAVPEPGTLVLVGSMVVFIRGIGRRETA